MNPVLPIEVTGEDVRKIEIANVIDETFVTEQREEIVKQIQTMEALLQDLDRKRVECQTIKTKCEGALVVCDVFLNKMRQPPSEA